MSCGGVHYGCTRTKENSEGNDAIPMARGPWIKSFQKQHYWYDVQTCTSCTFWKQLAPTIMARFIFDLVLSSFQSLRKPLRTHLSVNCKQFCGVFCILFCFCFFIKVDPPKPKSGLGKSFIQEERKNGLSKCDCSFRVVLQNTLIYKAILAVELGHF